MILTVNHYFDPFSKLYIVPVGTAKDELDREDVIVKSTDSGANITQPISSDWHNRRSESLLSPLITISVLRETGILFSTKHFERAHQLCRELWSKANPPQQLHLLLFLQLGICSFADKLHRLNSVRES